MKKVFVLILAVVGLFAFKSTKDIASLKDAYEPYFLLGTAMNSEQINGTDIKGEALIIKHFNVITPENVMKMEVIHPEADKYDFVLADKLVDKAEKNNLAVVGHTLVWHSQQAPWFEEITDGAEMDKALKNHITSVVGRYKGRIGAWDVVNEAINDDGSYRESNLYNVLGKDYIKKAFVYASEVDPNAKLYYNDYNMVMKGKREGVVRMVKEMQKEGVRIDGIGIQGHWNLHWPLLEEIEASIIEYSKLGVEVMVTELDITVLPNPWDLQGADVNQNYEGSPFMNPYPDPAALPDSVKEALAERYESIFKLFLKHKDKVTRVTLWGVSDRNSWLNGWPIKDRTNYPLLFDREDEPKKAFYSVLKAAQEAR